MANMDMIIHHHNHDGTPWIRVFLPEDRVVDLDLNEARDLRDDLARALEVYEPRPPGFATMSPS